MLSSPIEHAGRILIMRLDNIGDIVMLSPALRALRKHIPQAHLTLMASPAGSQVAPLLPWVDEVVTWRAMWQDISDSGETDAGREFNLVRQLRERRYDAALIFTSFSQSPHPPAYACYLAEIPVRVGQSKEFGGRVLSHAAQPPLDAGHQVDRNLALLESINVPLDGRQMELALPKAVRKAAKRLLVEAGVDPKAPFILLAPGASCSARRYPPARYAEVAHMLADQSGWPVVVAGSRRERKTLAPVLDIADGKTVISLVGQSSVPELAALVARASLVLANNSAALHIADAFRRPVVVTYSGTEYESQWRPRYSAMRLLRKPTACSPCYRFECPFQLECLEFTPSEVTRSALDLLQEVVSPHSQQINSAIQPMSVQT